MSANNKDKDNNYDILLKFHEVGMFSGKFPSNSKVVVRIFDLNGTLITSLLEKYYESSGTINRIEDKSDWDGRNHLGQVVPPGTYLMHIEASNFQTGKTTSDIAPVVIGVKK